MPFRFIEQPLHSGLYEPEGLYLNLPYATDSARDADIWICGRWAEFSEEYAPLTYNGVPLKGNTGLDFALPPFTPILAVDHGRVIEISMEPGGFERYIKVEHRWGESLYAYLGRTAVDSGRLVKRGEQLASSTSPLRGYPVARFHLAVRINPFNRYDGYGGFTDPLPYLVPADLPPFQPPSALDDLPPHPMTAETKQTRRP